MKEKITNRAISVDELERKKFTELNFEGEWKDLLGVPEANGCWIIWGHSGHGKSRFCMQLAKELTKFGRVAYNTLEEGARKSMQKNIIDCQMKDVANRFVILNREPISELKVRLRARKHPNFVFIDSFQYTHLTYKQYIELKEEFPDVLFIMVSHAEGKLPEGKPANRVRYDADVKIRVEGFKAFSGSRTGGGTPYVIWEQGAANYWIDVE
jgi:hypothetical protein